MEIKRFVFNMFDVNTYIVWDSNTLCAAIIDPGMINDEERKKLTDFIEANNLTIAHLLNTHLHFDHIFGNKFVEHKYGVKTEACNFDEFLLPICIDRAADFNLSSNLFEELEIGKTIKTGDEILIGETKLSVIQLPGHSPGSVIFYNSESGVLFSGDALFKLGVGRTDLWQGDYEQLISGLKENIMNLPEQTVIYPGHGPSTTIAIEKQYNPFLH